MILSALVAAAISLKVPMEQAAAAFAAASPGEAVTFTFGSSGQLVAQIEHGAPVDLFVSASPAELDRLAAAGRIDAASRASIAGNRLVVIAGPGVAPPRDLADLASPRFARIAIGNPATVPVGRYARQALAAAGALGAIESRLVLSENARQLVALVARGEADAAIVYATDAASIGPSRITAIPAALHEPVVYEAALLKGAASRDRADAFLRFLASQPGAAILARHGFAAPVLPAPE